MSTIAPILSRETEGAKEGGIRIEAGSIAEFTLTNPDGICYNGRRMLASGTRFGPYEIVGHLDSGGMGEVYRATDTRLGRFVALKIIAPQRANDPDAVARFEREARTIASLSHPNILTLFDIGSEQDTLFIVGELFEGETLRDRIRRSPLPWRKAAEIAAAIASGLAAAHAREIVHRDIKPENIFLTADGQVKILDFGVARLDPHLAGDRTHTGTDPGTILGTAGYMSPEQVRGEHVDGRSDLFSLGAVLYEMVTGQRAFVASTSVETMAAILNEDPLDKPETSRQVPSELAAVLRHTLEKHANERFQSARDLAFALRSLGIGSGTAAAMPASPTNRRVVLAGSLAMLIVIAVGAAYFWPSRGEPLPVGDPNDLKVASITGDGRSSTAAISPDGRHVAYVTEDGRGRRTMRLQQRATGSSVEVVPATDEEYSNLTFSPDGDFIYYTRAKAGDLASTVYRVPALGGQPQTILRDVWTGVSFSPDGTRIAFTRGDVRTRDTSLNVARPDGSQERTVVRKSASLFSTAWYSNEEIAAIASRSQADTSIELIKVADGSVRALGSEPVSPASPIVRDPEGGLLIVGRDSQIHRIAPDGSTRRITNDLSPYEGLSITADGDSLVTTTAGGQASIFVEDPPGHWRRISAEAGRDDGVMGITWAAGGRLVYTARAGQGSQIWSMRPDGGDRRQLTRAGGLSPAASPDGRQIAFVEKQGDRSHISVIRDDGGDARALTDLPSASSPSWMPDGRSVVFNARVDDTLSVMQVPAAGGQTSHLFREYFFLPAASPDGKWIAGWTLGDGQKLRLTIAEYGSETNRRFLWQSGDFAPGQRWLPGGKAIGVVRAAGGTEDIWLVPIDGSAPTQLTHFADEQIFSFAWSPDGRYLACARGSFTSDVVAISGLKNWRR